MSQKAVARIVGVDQPQVSDWESGKHAPDPVHFMLLVHLFPELVEEMRELINTLALKRAAKVEEQSQEEAPVTEKSAP